MDIKELFFSCRKGDLSRVKYLVEQKEVQMNIRDKWDSTPLYYACLCGHLDVVRYLLECGARCESNTFDGERCFYGALTTEIRNMLRHDYQVITSQTIRRDSYDAFLRWCLEDETYSDIAFVVGGDFIKAHRCILSVRCEYFANMFLDKWSGRRRIHIAHSKVTAVAFRAILQFLYTGRLEASLDSVDDIVVVAKQCSLTNLISQVNDCVKKISTFRKSKPGMKVTTLVVENDENNLSLQRDFGVLAEKALPPQLTTWIAGMEFLPNVSSSTFCDITFEVQGQFFLCHKVFFCGRSDYFKALLSDHFLESSETDCGLPVASLKDVSLEVFHCILCYLYQNTAELSAENAYEVLCVADLYLLPGLKRLCGSFIAQQLDTTNIVELLKAARVYSLPQLEDACTEYIAKHLENVINNKDFHAIILEDAKEVQERQETDSISVIDDIRFHITNNVQTFSAMEEAQEKLKLIDKTLDLLGLDA